MNHYDNQVLFLFLNQQYSLFWEGIYQYETPARLDYIFNFKNGKLKWDCKKSNALGSGNQIESIKSIL